MNYLPNLFINYYGRVVLTMGAIFLAVIGLAACQDTDGGPLGPSSNVIGTNITLSPSTITIAKNGAQTFTAIGGTGSFTFSLGDTSLGTLGTPATNSVPFTAGNTAGTLTVTATDTNGATGTATVTIGNKNLTINPTQGKVGRSGNITFTVTGGTDPISFALTNTALGSFPATTGVFTANSTLGNTTVTATDADGDTITANVEVVANQITIAPLAAAFTTATQAVTFTPTGGAGNSYSYALSGFTGTYTVAATDVTVVPAAADNINVVITTVGLPTALEGDQNLTLTVTDGNGDTGTASIFVKSL